MNMSVQRGERGVMRRYGETAVIDGRVWMVYRVGLVRVRWHGGLFRGSARVPLRRQLDRRSAKRRHELVHERLLFPQLAVSRIRPLLHRRGSLGISAGVLPAMIHQLLQDGLHRRIRPGLLHHLSRLGAMFCLLFLARDGEFAKQVINDRRLSIDL